MGLRNLICVALGAMLLVGCGTYNSNRGEIRSVGLSCVEWEAQAQRDGVMPKHITLAVDLVNKGAAVVLREGRLRVSYNGSRVLLLSLEERVKLPRHFEGVVELPLRVAVARNSQTLALRNALFQHQSEGITIDWEFSLRAGVVRSRVVQAEEPLQEILSEEKIAALWSIVEEMKEER